MSHTTKVNLVADQEIRLLGKDINIYDLQTIFVECDGKIVDYSLKKASQHTVEADAEGCNACGFNKKFGTLNYCANCGKNLRTA